jgi:hypothetical protein
MCTHARASLTEVNCIGLSVAVIHRPVRRIVSLRMRSRACDRHSCATASANGSLEIYTPTHPDKKRIGRTHRQYPSGGRAQFASVQADLISWTCVDRVRVRSRRRINVHDRHSVIEPLDVRLRASPRTIGDVAADLR